MNINQTLKDRLSKDGYLNIANMEKQLKDFLCGGERFHGEDGFRTRRELAERIIKSIMDPHNKGDLHTCVGELGNVEQGTRNLDERTRDHVVHALLTFILGIYMNKYFMNERYGETIKDLQWKICGMFHDVGYPVEIASRIIKGYVNNINGIKKKIDLEVPDVSFNIGFTVPDGASNTVSSILTCLQNEKNSLCLIQKVVDDWKLQIHVRDEYDRLMKNGNVCHGILSSLSVLYVIDLIYQKHNPKREYKTIYHKESDCNQDHFDKQIVPACAAIFLHNLPAHCFKDAKIHPEYAPLPYLLKLCDTLQDWERPSTEDQDGFPPGLYDIEVQDGKLIFYAKERKRDLEKELSDFLIMDDIVIKKVKQPLACSQHFLF